MCIARDAPPRFLDGHRGLTRSANKSEAGSVFSSPLLVFGFDAGIIRKLARMKRIVRALDEIVEGASRNRNK